MIHSANNHTPQLSPNVQEQYLPQRLSLLVLRRYHLKRPFATVSSYIRMAASPRCRGMACGWAIVLISLLAGCHKKPVQWTPPPSIGSGNQPFDLLWPSDGDLNRLPLNPEWETQVSNPQQLPPPASPEACVREPYLPVCTDQIPSPPPPKNIDVAVFPNILICGLDPLAKVHGHVNWLPATYIGAIQWWNFATDFDYNFALLPGDYQGLTQYNMELTNGNPALRFIEPEFDSNETVVRFTTAWWTKFARTVDTGNYAAIEAMLSPSDPTRAPQAVVTGLFGLDCEHDCRSEVHPVYALAIEIDDSPGDNTWAIFVRNWGNEGFCSALDHQMDFDQNQVKLFLPRLSNGTSAVLPSTEFAATDTSVTTFPAITQVQGQGTEMTFTLPGPQEHALAELVLHLQWTGDTYKRPKVLIRSLTAAMASLQASAESPGSRSVETQNAESYLGQLYRSKLNAAPQSFKMPAPAAAAPQKNARIAVPHTVEMKKATTKDVQSELHKTKPPSEVTPSSSTIAVDKLRRDCEYLRAICSAYGNNPPTDKVQNFAQLCQQLNEGDACTQAVGRATRQVR